MKNVFVYLHTGCGYRMLDAQRFRDYFLKNGFTLVHDPREADYIIFFTCGVTNGIAKLCADLIKKFMEYDAELIVAGCLPKIRPELVAESFDGKVIVTPDLINDTKKIDKLFPNNKVKFSDVPDAYIIELGKGNLYERLLKKTVLQNKNTPYSAIIALLLLEIIPIKLRRFVLNSIWGEDSVILQYVSGLTHRSICCIRVGWGCKGNCSYCGTKKAIGAYRSKPINLVLDEFKQGLKEGYKNFWIFAPDLGPYGIDMGSSLPELMNELLGFKGEHKIFLGGLNPVWMVKYVDCFESILEKGVIRGMEVPIQSGSDRILRLMNRYDRVEKIKEAYLRLREAYPELMLYTHIMLGFPTEKDEDVEKTLSLISDVRFSGGMVFNWSCIPGTEAEKIEPKVPKNVLFERNRYVRRVLKREGYSVFWHKSYGFFMSR